MPPKILSGKEAGAALIARIAQATAQQAAQNQRSPYLVVVQVGGDPASNTYIKQKAKAAADCGFGYHHELIPRDASEREIAQRISRYADEPGVDGMILQLPLDSATVKDPKRVQALLSCIPPDKDADGLDIVNQGHLFAGESPVEGPEISPYPIPATALGVVRLLQHFQIPVKGKRVTVVGRSRLVGAPVSALLMHMGGTVTTCHRYTQDLIRHTRDAEILVVCAGKKHLITPQHVMPGAVVIDVGIHVQENGKLTGDVHPDCYPLLAAYSPVPGGVGPMTVAGLMENTLNLRMMRED